MATKRTASAQRDLENLLRRDHTLLGGILFGIDGYIIEIQARAVRVLSRPASWWSVTNISGMAKGAIGEALSRISGAFAKLQIPEPGHLLEAKTFVVGGVLRDASWAVQSARFLPEKAAGPK